MLQRRRSWVASVGAVAIAAAAGAFSVVSAGAGTARPAAAAPPVCQDAADSELQARAMAKACGQRVEVASARIERVQRLLREQWLV
jgi:hypothetical protein